MFNRTTSANFFTPRHRQRTDQPLAEPSSQRVLTADFRRYSQIRIRTFHRRDAEYAEEIPFAQSGDDDWAKTFSSNLRNVFVCRRLPTNKKLILCALCGSTLLTILSPSKDASAVRFLKGFLSVYICVNLRLIAFDPLCFASSPIDSPRGPVVRVPSPP
jgi:hypothetical protein